MVTSSTDENPSVDFANDSNTLLLIDSGLRNDTVPESFRLKHVVNEQYLPCKYIKITPLECWKPSFNFSIWYVGLEGEDSTDIVQSALSWHDEVCFIFTDMAWIFSFKWFIWSLF